MKITFLARENGETFEIENKEEGEAISLFIREFQLRYGNLFPEILIALGESWEEFQIEGKSEYNRFDFSDPENDFVIAIIAFE